MLTMFYAFLIALPNAVGTTGKYDAAMDAARSASMEASGANQAIRQFNSWADKTFVPPHIKPTLATGYFIYNTVRTQTLTLAFPIWKRNTETIRMSTDGASVEMSWSI